MTKDVINKIPDHVKTKVEGFRRAYKRATDFNIREAVKAEMAGYALGLRDAGLLTDRERQILFIYMTV